MIKDESQAQNTTNSTRCFCSPVIDRVKDKIKNSKEHVKKNIILIIIKSIEFENNNYYPIKQ